MSQLICWQNIEHMLAEDVKGNGQDVHTSVKVLCHKSILYVQHSPKGVNDEFVCVWQGEISPHAENTYSVMKKENQVQYQPGLRRQRMKTKKTKMMTMTSHSRRALRYQQGLHLVVLKYLVQPDEFQGQSAEIQTRIHLSQLWLALHLLVFLGSNLNVWNLEEKCRSGSLQVEVWVVVEVLQEDHDCRLPE